MQKAELAKKIYEVAYLKGEFKLRSGKTSNEYFDKYRFEARPEILREIAKHMKTLIPADTEVLAGLEMGGIPIATALSLETGIPCAFVRKKAKEYGTCLFAEGIDVKAKKVLVIEDVVTTGGQVALSSKDLRSLGALITTVLCAIHRGPEAVDLLKKEGLQLKALFTMEELKSKIS